MSADLNPSSLTFDNDGFITVPNVLNLNTNGITINPPKSVTPKKGYGYTIGCFGETEQETYWVYDVGRYLGRYLLRSLVPGSIDNSIMFNSIDYSQKLGVFVASSNQNNFARSTDGINWTYHDTGDNNLNWTGVVWNSEDELFFAVGASTNNGSYSTSPDGINWTMNRIVGAIPNINVAGLTWVKEKNLYIVSGNGAYINISFNVTLWQTVPVFGGSWINSAYSPSLDLFVLVGLGSSNIAYTNNPYAWNLVDISSNKNWTDVAWSPKLGMFVIVGRSSNDNIYYSYDGINWSLANTLINGIGFLFVKWIEEFDMFIAGRNTANSTEKNITYSYDGINWYLLSSFDQEMRVTDVIWSTSIGRFIFIGMGGTNRSYLTP